ncbi:DNA polymerase eta [Acromyrmex echinatior]|uniref:DNA polymerase eta n=1 Tax=Acromyrmex echinatior TaxID=103372 RepID=F4W7P3_ACREC|nr:DNA polymerase eta [Acromyrmex echinatior]
MASSNNRIVVLIDMDCFFCQVEIKLQPQHEGKPLAVVQYNQWEMGGIIAVNYEARSFGVTRHMRGKEAKEKCPDIVLVSVPCLRGKADTSRYRKAGREVIQVIKKHCNVIERASVDEAYLDITDIVDKRLAASKVSPKQLISFLANTYVVGYSEINKNNEEERCKGLQTWILNSFKELHDDQAQKLAIAGIIILAKLACGLHKPNRQTILPEAAVSSLYSTLPVKKVRNLGGKFGDVVVESLGCKVMGDLLQYSLEQLKKHFDEKTGFWLYNIARGIDDEPVTNRLLAKSIGACKKFPGKQAITSLEVLKHWAGDLAAEVCERLEEDFIENQRRATLLVISYHYYHNRSTVSQTRSLALNSYKPEKMANQCVDVITKSTQYPVAFMGISVTKFVPSKESGSFLKFFKNTKLKDEEEVVILNSHRDTMNSMSNSEAKEKTLSNSKEVYSLESKRQKSQKVKESTSKTNEGMMKGSKRIIDLNTSAEDSPTSKRVSKLIQVCNERDKTRTKNKRLPGMIINNNDFQNSFFMNVYKTEEKKCYNNVDEITNTMEESKCKKRLIVSNANEKNVNDENIDDYNIDLRKQVNVYETPSTRHVHMHVNSNNEEPTEENNKRTCAQDPLMRLREIFPDLDDIDPDILSLLPVDLQEEAKLYMKSRSKKQENIKISWELPKTGRGRPSKATLAGKSDKKRSPLYNFLIKTNSDKYNVPLERCAECNQMIPITKFSEHVDFHVAQNLYQEINKPTSSENGNAKRKLEDDEVNVFMKRQTSNVCESNKDFRSATTSLS